MSFFDLIKRFIIYTLKEIYSFFLKITLLIFIITLIGVTSTTYFYSKYKDENKIINRDYSYVVFGVNDIAEDKFEDHIWTGVSSYDKYNINYFDILSALNNIKENNDIKGLIINLDETKLSITHKEELVEKFKELKKANKKIYAIGGYIDNSNYLLASVADEVILYPTNSAGFSLTGYHYSNLYYKELLNKIGVNVEIIRVGNYKSFGENYISNKMSEGLKEEMTRILDRRFNIFVENISETRNMDKYELENEILSGNLVNITPFEARDYNFVNTLEYYDEFYNRNNIKEDEVISIYDYYKDKKSEINSKLKNRDNDGTIAVIYAEGGIVYGNEGGQNNILISPDSISSKIKELNKIEDLRGIVLRVNSPGGSALASEMIYQMLSKLEVPIYVSMGNVAASGGYYISMVGEKVFSNRNTITGSIGVVSMYPKLYNAQNKYGIKSNSISKGKYSELYDSFIPTSEEAKEKLRQSMSKTYVEFKSRVIENRNLTMDELENYAQGRIWLGEEAKEIKLVDDNVSLEKTIERLAEDLELENYNIENVYNKNNFFDTFKELGSFIMSDINIFRGVNKYYAKKGVIDEVNMILTHPNTQLYYLPNSELY